MKQYLKLEALAAVRQGEVQSGIEKYLEYLGLEENRTDDDAWAALGGAFRRLEKIGDALECYRKAFEQNPLSTYALVNLVSLKAARDTPEDRDDLARLLPEAIDRCRKTIEGGGANFWNWYDLGTLHLLAGNLPEARKIFPHAVAQTPESAKENFRSVLSNLEFLRRHNARIPGIEEVIALVSPFA